jgi:hypothetical protein
MTLADYAAQKAAAAAAAAADKRAGKGETAPVTPERRTASGKPRRQREAPKSSETVSTDDDTDETNGHDETDSEDSESDGKELAAAEPASARGGASGVRGWIEEAQG